ncbi:MAG TPA: T9SS type A sorting domain-containing protein [Saprospiraceae bacterium]|nr:T9SS type A sorting domain-containing protein [Saprospiraceae bacterium]
MKRINPIFFLFALCAMLQSPLMAQSGELVIEYQSGDGNLIDGLDDFGGFNTGFMDYTDDACMVFRVAQTLVIRNLSANKTYFLSPDDIPDPDYNLANYRFAGFFNIAGDEVEELVLAPKFDHMGQVYVCSLNPDGHFTPSFSLSSNTPGSQLVACANMDGDDHIEILIRFFGENAPVKFMVLGLGYTPGFQAETPTDQFGSPCKLGMFEIQDILPPNYRWPENRVLMPPGSRDFNSNGSIDLSYLKFNGASGELLVIDGATHDTTLDFHGIPEDFELKSYTKVAYLNVCETGSKTVLLGGSDLGQRLRDMEIILLIDTSTGEIVWSLQPYLDNGFRVVGITKCGQCGDGRLKFILSHQNTGRLLVIWPGWDFHSSGGAEWNAPANGRNENYSLNLVWESSTNANTYMPLKLDFDLSDLDLNNDGILDLPSIVMQDSLSNNSVGINVTDGNTGQIIWDTPIPGGGFNDPAPYFHGFFDANGDGEKEMFFGAETVQTADGTIHKPFNTGFAMEYIYDLNGDGFPEVIGKNSSGKLQVYSSSALSAVFEANLQALGKLAVSPNPTTGMLHISWNQPEAGALLFELYDERGRLVQTTQLGDIAAGETSLPIQLSESLPNGLYMARMISDQGSSPAFVVLQR